MCTEHSVAIDDGKTVSSYPVELLREWKAEQLEEYDRIQQGWTLNEEMALEAISKSATIELMFTDSEINLGGTGGSAPGAGGGGGGAIGTNTRGGDGGKGGDSYSALIDFSNEGGVRVREMRVTIGEGGKAPHLPGQHSNAGGDTLVEFLGIDGDVLHTIRAKGGGATRSAASYLPEGVEQISQKDVEEGFRISSLLPINSGEIREGLLNILSGGWSYVVAPSIPVDMGWNIAIIASWASKSIELPKGLFLSMHDPMGAERACIGIVLPEMAPGATSLICLTSIGATIDQEGHWLLRVSSGEFVLNEFIVRAQVPISS